MGIGKMILAASIGALLPMGCYTGTALAASDGIHVDQVGYLTNHAKIAMVSLTDAENSFCLVDAVTGQKVYEGKIGVQNNDAMSGDKVTSQAGTSW